MTDVPGQAPNGQWARTRNTENAKLFLAEQEQQSAAAGRRFRSTFVTRLGWVVLAVLLAGLLVLGILGF
ncbi:MAG: hypothetical protein GEV07_26970 [Streptosporangiales bacterium]|nr:hypothetical protein [Streptosporangiales bacterium]